MKKSYFELEAELKLQEAKLKSYENEMEQLLNSQSTSVLRSTELFVSPLCCKDIEAYCSDRELCSLAISGINRDIRRTKNEIKKISKLMALKRKEHSAYNGGKENS